METNDMMILKDRRPRVACEFSSTQVVAARLGESGVVDSFSARALPPGALVPALMGVNVTAREAVRTAIQDTVAELGCGRDVTAILPDASCRVILIDLEVLPDRPGEADAFVRLRLRRSLPFDIEKACVSWQAQGVNGKTNVLAAVTQNAVLEEYESVVREAGCNPGFVLPSILATLGLVDATVPTLLIKIDPATISLAVVNNLAVLLLRILDRAPDEPAAGTQLLAAVHHSLAFCQDAHGTKVQGILVSSVTPLEELSSLLEESTGVRPQALVYPAGLQAACGSQDAMLGAVAGALAQEKLAQVSRKRPR